MDEKELDALAALVAAGRRKAGDTAVLAKALSGRREFSETPRKEELLRVLYEDVPLAIRAQKLTEKALKQIAGEAERGRASEDALRQAADRLRETSALAQDALDDVHRDLRELEALAR